MDGMRGGEVGLCVCVWALTVESWAAERWVNGEGLLTATQGFGKGSDLRIQHH